MLSTNAVFAFNNIRVESLVLFRVPVISISRATYTLCKCKFKLLDLFTNLTSFNTLLFKFRLERLDVLLVCNNLLICFHDFLILRLIRIKNNINLCILLFGHGPSFDTLSEFIDCLTNFQHSIFTHTNSYLFVDTFGSLDNLLKQRTETFSVIRNILIPMCGN